MISIENLHVEFGARPLYDNVSFVINDRDRIALVGKNGAGKSTLLKIIHGEQSPTSGVISIPNETTIGYLPQVMRIQDDTTVKDEALKAFANTISLKKELEAKQEEMAERDDYDSDEYMQLVETFTSLQDRFVMMGGDHYEGEIERTLQGLGFKRTDFQRPTSEFSGGWRMRIELAKILLKKPDVLLLDEPTNHLDIESIQWLEQYIAQSSCAVVLVSHDRAFINNVTNRTIEITCGHIEDYKVKYNEYVILRKERREQQIRVYENQQKEIADTKAFIDRFRYQASKAIQVQQRIRQLEKIVPIEIDEIDTSALRLKFPPCLRSGDYPIICDEVEKTYTHNVFKNVNLIIKRGEKVAFVGKNGEGKSTLIKCIMNEIPFGGTLKIGHNVKIGYFAQNQAQMLDDTLTVYETIDHVAKGEIRLRINDILGAFMFGGEASEKKVKFLSGGERSRLAMIRLLLEPVNLLILDEPTNHLDMKSKDVLKDAIRAFDGTAIIVSHDREFLDGLIEKVYEFKGGAVKEYIGGIYDWIKEHEESESKLSVQSSVEKELAKEQKTSNSQQQPVFSDSDIMSYAERKERMKQISRIQKQIAETENKIAEEEEKLSELDSLLCNPDNASDMELVSKYTQVQSILEEEMKKWEELSTRLEEIKI